MYKSAILGCRGRARGHARAYQHVKGGKLAAICDMKEDLLNDFGDEFGIDARYTDLDEMLSKEKPDLLHIVTAPVLRGSNERIRYPLMNQAAEHDVPAAIVEKPIAVESEDWRKGAEEHNLKNVNTFIPHEKITVITGLSGSGKSSLAFDTIYAESQRRYIESLSYYARQYLHQLKKPKIHSITGLCPSIAIDQKTVSYNPRSTVGTVTEIYDYLRLLYARLGEGLCPEHKTSLTGQTPEEIVENILKRPQGEEFSILAPVAQQKKGEFLNEAQTWMKRGFVRARVNGKWIELSQMKRLARRKSHNIDLLVDRLLVDKKFKQRLQNSVHLALSTSKGLVTIEPKKSQPLTYSIYNTCEICGYHLPEMEPRMFSFNNPKGACTHCNGLGFLDLEAYDDGFEYEEDDELDELSLTVCTACQGYRLNEQARHVFIQKKHIGELQNLSAEKLLKFFLKLKFNKKQNVIAKPILKEIISRLNYMNQVGVEYLSLNRPSRTLSGGEGQRIRLASQLGSPLIGVLYVLDEPSIGLHSVDHEKLLSILKDIQKKGNTILLVEHDENTIRSAHHIIDLGPGAGRLGGLIQAEGTLKHIQKNKKSLTGAYLNKDKVISYPQTRRKGKGEKIILKGLTGNNLKNINVEIPLGVFCGVTGVSGSGKSTLIGDTLYRAAAQKINKSLLVPTPFKKIEGLQFIDKIIEINQKPIGRTPRSIPATYTQVFPLIRALYANLPEAQLRGYRPGSFSFNVKGGRCEHCQGMGKLKIQMAFLSDTYVSCEYCKERRYNQETLTISYRGESISDILNMTVDEACDFFKNHKLISQKLETLRRTGLGYIRLGQNSTTLSGGEAQRIKLSRELSKRSTGRTLYIMDEPSTGLHFADIEKLIELLHELVEQGNTVIVIEHNMEFIKNFDYLIDLGPHGGDNGGEVVACGTPEQVSKIKKSATGCYLKKVL